MDPVKHRRRGANAWLWWTAAIAAATGLTTWFALEPLSYETRVQNIRLFGLLIAILFPGICLIIATASRWFDR